MGWKKFDGNTLKLALSKDELDALGHFNVEDTDVQNVLDQIAHIWACTWRGSLRRFIRLNAEEDSLPESIFPFALAHARYQCWTRMPNSIGIDGLDERRAKEKEFADDVLRDPGDYVEPEEETEESQFTDPVVIKNYKTKKFEPCC